jgi:hypothetical protein
MRAVGWPAPGRRYSHPFFSVRSWNKLRATSVKARRTCRRSSRRSVCKFAVHERYAPTRREPEDWSDAMPESKSTCQETPAVPPYLEAAFAPARRLTAGYQGWRRSGPGRLSARSCPFPGRAYPALQSARSESVRGENESSFPLAALGNQISVHAARSGTSTTPTSRPLLCGRTSCSIA